MPSEAALAAPELAETHDAEATTAASTPGAVARDLFALSKPRLSSLVLITAGGGLWLARVPVSLGTTVGTMLGTTLVVAAANTLNNYLERESDVWMARTKTRPLPSGRMPASWALTQGLVLTAISLPLLSWTANALAGLLAAIALVLYVLVYTPLKRRSSISTFVGAIPGAMPPLIGTAAATGTIESTGLVLFGIMFLWQIPHFLAITLFRKGEYERAGLVVLPLTRGDRATSWQIVHYVLALIPLSLATVALGVGGTLTAVGATLLGFGFLYKAVQGLGPGAGPKQARSLFFFSLIYLTGLFAVLAVDRLFA